MGEMAEYMLNGDDCQECGEYIGPGCGFPRTCSGCRGSSKAGAVVSAKMLQCPDCMKWFKAEAAQEQHAAARKHRTLAQARAPKKRKAVKQRGEATP